ncbi:hypothetical protein AB0D27_45470 [Streptomyces sp. NPDC048415]|uniref:hypothetical protein n=1 Tax=Streptomyces sp. NPDC048415 TaxID=3154822 RepID=UPI00341F7FD2
MHNKLVQAGYPELPGVGVAALHKSVAANGSAWVVSAIAKGIRDREGLEEVLAWLRDAAEIGNASATSAAVEILIEVGRDSEALSWFQRAAASGRLETAYEASLAAAEVLKKAGRIDESLTWYQRAASATGLPEWLRDAPLGAACGAAMMLQEAGRTGDIPAWLWQRAEAGDALTMITLITVLEEAGKNDELFAWLRVRAERGDPLAMYAMARGLKNILGRSEEAEYWFQRAITYFQSLEGAQTWHRRLKEWSGDEFSDGPTALELTVDMLEVTGPAEEADAWIRDRAEAGDRTAAKELVSCASS